LCAHVTYPKLRDSKLDGSSVDALRENPVAAICLG
jgi:hypothetical protein